MKNFALILIFAMTTFMAAKAQTHYRAHFSVGFKGGMTMNEVSFNPSVNQAWTKGSGGAVLVRYSEEKLFGLTAELGWVTRGWKEDYKNEGLSYSRRATYLTLPILTNITFGTRRLKFNIELGPSVSYLLSSSIKSDFDYHNPDSVPCFPATSQTEQLTAEISHRFDYGINAGLGVEFRLTPRQSVQVGGRYYYGLGNMFPSSKADTFSASRNMTIEVSAAYLFRVR